MPLTYLKGSLCIRVLFIMRVHFIFTTILVFNLLSIKVTTSGISLLRGHKVYKNFLTSHNYGFANIWGLQKFDLLRSSRIIPPHREAFGPPKALVVIK